MEPVDDAAIQDVGPKYYSPKSLRQMMVEYITAHPQLLSRCYRLAVRATAFTLFASWPVCLIHYIIQACHSCAADPCASVASYVVDDPSGTVGVLPVDVLRSVLVNCTEDQLSEIEEICS